MNRRYRIVTHRPLVPLSSLVARRFRGAVLLERSRCLRELQARASALEQFGLWEQAAELRRQVINIESKAPDDTAILLIKNVVSDSSEDVPLRVKSRRSRNGHVRKRAGRLKSAKAKTGRKRKRRRKT
jgi:hypothetical protein